ncbi:MAG TPA: hypothetical protein IAC28_04610 [Candidatus Aphodovivens excrementavium]|nr:hypothetical protein [Candidatus Aphodovivens excrementavium]
MPALQVKDFPGDLYLDLKACANAEDRSVSQQTLHILRQYLKAYRQLGGRTDWKVVPVELVPDEGKTRSRTQEEERQERIEQRKKVLERIHSRSHSKIPDDFPSAAEIVRQMREERDDQIAPDLAGIR